MIVYLSHVQTMCINMIVYQAHVQTIMLIHSLYMCLIYNHVNTSTCTDCVLTWLYIKYMYRLCVLTWLYIKHMYRLCINMIVHQAHVQTVCINMIVHISSYLLPSNIIICIYVNWQDLSWIFILLHWFM